MVPPSKRDSCDVSLRRYDVLDFVRNLPPGLRPRLQRYELEGVLYVFCANRLSSHWLTMARRYEFMEEALGDLSASVHHLTQRPAHAGLAKWAGQQALEKVFKGYLHHAGLRFATGGKDGHNLERMASELGGAAEDWGRSTNILCAKCSRGLPHEHTDAPENPAHPHCGLAARDDDHAEAIIRA